MTDEERLAIIKLTYEEHDELKNKEVEVEKISWNDGAMFGIRFVLIALGYKFNFEDWEI